ncbi:class I SAM-dependent methyltransferase [Blastochloris viridis]|uniref:16S ribosomal RNA methyltransferase KsgA/Dim1 family protein n=1 Tax=Blastochloris viridis TaxID=1079 RepID=A0A0H5BE19_BLAVI|nr:rRNA adenine N-6-methyltransferase family protein [Blastochloris viridis]ALK10697.1 Ribosomal RNA small subunit methyltransferase A [Blastochloris viridis]BAR99339.1 phosphatidylethanolamine N-methyltransferase [Blastochloris viridis]CUU43360.1 16S ribosomal RNA methyltransferase KsgA/Dim1 family protein [Blastochloris viridis]
MLQKTLQQKKPLRLDDELRFLQSWFQRPLTTGAVAPSGRALAKAMAEQVDLARPGPVVELGPGTGAVTEALIARGLDPSRLVLVEFNTEFSHLMSRRYPTATVVHGDAYTLTRTLRHQLAEPAAAVVSSLPLFTKPLLHRLTLLNAAFRLMQPGAPFIQFTYAVVPPIPKDAGDYTATVTRRIWLNVPPARVWVYRRA